MGVTHIKAFTSRRSRRLRGSPRDPQLRDDTRRLPGNIGVDLPLRVRERGRYRIHRLVESALMKYLQTQNAKVFEVSPLDRTLRRKAGKTDAVDAEAATRAVIASRSLATPITGISAAEELRQMWLVKLSAVKGRTTVINQLESLVVGAEPALAINSIQTPPKPSVGQRSAAAQHSRTNADE